MIFVTLQSGPLVWAIISVGNVALIWGIWNFAVGRNRTTLTLQLCLAVVPAALGALGALLGYLDWMAIAASTAPPKPSEFAAKISAGLLSGLWGGGLTVLAAAPGIAALSRHAARWSEPPPST
ncbi:hypothetical protein [Alienimonas chondri]|uniref:MotA/TolQ/ExbB proton channel family protein n=1 Tax=Alienimonas chondri TaxID=2681879 RepID=A0ABX1VA04_9PLAN|nr:hypothetical protein [Alienimonas chondri]NNJ24924.1 hypothetical protein [Alienimonas chondri]